ncbi:MAG: D-glycero-beta-D-manno-heptose-7-phosphate kinase [Selenomonas sp.]|nr:D-glycero-beta-D-manno-heptose-7-phosphate kinase [Selenomonas sp.]
MDAQRLRDFLATKPEQCHVLVVGDIMLDKYYYGDVTRISGEAPVPITRVNSSSEKLGGSANIAYSLAVLGCRVSIAGFVGRDSHCESLVERFKNYGIDTDGLIYTERPTTTKVRIMSGNQQMFRLDFEDDRPIALQDMARYEQYIGEKLSESLDCVIISDHANGACTDASCSWIIEKCHNHGVPVVVDMSAATWVNYRKADYVVANLKRINKELLQPAENEDGAVEKACHYLMRKFHVKNVIATRSQQGLSLVRSDETVHIPTEAQELFDVLGATDAVTAVFGLAVAGGLPPALGAYLANLAASRVVTRLGTYAVTREELAELLIS